MPRANPDVNYEISIHALLAESDRSLLLPVRGSRISIHALLAESDHQPQKRDLPAGYFYPRSPCGERQYISKAFWIPCDFYPRSPCGERHIHRMPGPEFADFYPRSPCGERQPGERHASSQQEFLSTLSLRRATRIFLDLTLQERDFYPRSPCGERHVSAPLHRRQ